MSGLLVERDDAVTQTRQLTQELATARAAAARVQGDLDQVREALAEQTAAAAGLGERVRVETARRSSQPAASSPKTAQ